MTDFPSIDRLQDATVYDAAGNQVGTVAQIYFDEDTSEPTFVTVQTETSGTQEIFIPLHRATEAQDGDGVQVPFELAVITDAPSITADGTLTPEEEDRLHDYYSLDHTPAGNQDTETDNDAVLVRNEELVVGTERRSSGQARLRKRTTTTTETVQVPVTREEIVLEREPVDPDSAEARAADAGDNEMVVETQEEVPVVTKKVSAEKVSLDTATVQDTETVSETLRHDDVDVDRDAAKERKNRKG
ncbi:MAG: hypothetical protein MOP51_487 [Citricoccus sp.]|nr:hypothetical protein [Citricoccus sp. WCRC_4]